MRLTFHAFMGRVPANASALIDSLGGPARVAELLGYDRSAGGTQRVHNWRTRGIPAAVRLAHPEVFALPKEPPKPEPQPGQGARELSDQPA